MRSEVIIVTSEFPPGPGGIGKHAYHLATHLQAEGYFVKVIAEGRKEYPPTPWKDLNVEYIPRLPAFAALYFTVSVAWRLVGKSKTVIATGRKSLFASTFGLLFGHKLLAVLHGHEVLRGSELLKKIYSFIINRYSYVVAVSEFSKSVSIARIKIPIHVIPNGISTNAVGKAISDSPLPDSLKFLTVGTISKRKGQRNMLALMPGIVHHYPNASYVMAGFVREPETIFPLIGSLNLKDSVEVKGVVTDEALESLYRNRDIFVMLSENQDNGEVEGFGIAILEANSYGIPAIGAKGCGIEDAIKEGFSGHLVRLHDSGEFMQAVAKIIAHYPTYSANALQWAQEHDWKKIVKKYVSLIGPAGSDL